MIEQAAQTKKWIVISGLPGNGKTTLGFSLAKLMNGQNDPTHAFDQDLAEEQRSLTGRLFGYLGEYAKRNGLKEDFLIGASEILKPSRSILLQTMILEAALTIQQGANAITMANLREKDYSEAGFFKEACRLHSFLTGEKVEYVGVYLMPHTAGNLAAIECRGYEYDKLLLQNWARDWGGEHFAQTVERYLKAGHGSAYLGDEPKAEHLLFDTWNVPDRSPQKLAAGLLGQIDTIKGHVIEPRRARPGEMEAMSWVDQRRLFPGILAA